jgi:hypothetical protein
VTEPFEERRAIPSHILGYVDKRIVEYTERVEGFLETCAAKSHEEFKSHTREEMDRYKAIEDKVAAHAVSSTERHEAVMEKIAENNEALTEIHTLFKTAFPQGDAAQHRLAHEAWIEKAKEDKEFLLKLKQHLVNWATVAVLGWGSGVIWIAFLQGPK